MDHKSDRREVVAVMVDKRAAAGVVLERPAHAVHDKTRAVLLLRQLPQFFQPEAEALR